MEDLIVKNNNNELDLNNEKSLSMIKDLKIADLPKKISEQVEQVKKLSEKIEKAKTKAESSKNNAISASEVSAGLGHKKEAIESLQEATVQIAAANSDTVEAMQLSFSNQEKLAEITKYLFALGVYSVANTRVVIQELADELAKDGKENKLSDVAKQQLQSVISQLQAQGEIREKQESFDSKLDEHSFLIENIENQLDEVEKIELEQDERIENNAELLSEHEQVLYEQQQKDAEHDKRLAENDIRDSEQDVKIGHNAELLDEHEQMLSEQQQKDAEHDKRLSENDIRDSEQDVKISHNAELLDEHEQVLSEQQQKDAEHDKRLSENDIRDSEQDKKISLLKSNLEEHKDYVQSQLNKLYSKTECDKDDVVGLIEDYETTNKKRFEELSARIDAIDTTMKKKGWKIAVSIGVGTSLVLNLLHVFGVI